MEHQNHRGQTERVHVQEPRALNDPAVRHLGWMAALVALLSLVWPIYIFVAFPTMAEDMKARVERKRAERKP